MIFNFALFIILILGLTIGQGIGFIVGHLSSASAETVAGVANLTGLTISAVIDIAYRLNRGEEEDADAGFGLIHPKRGGQFMFIPLWILAGAFVLLALIGLFIP